MPGGRGALRGAARPLAPPRLPRGRTHIWYSSIASTSCPQESKSVPFLKLAPQRCRRLRAASDIAPALGHHAHPGPGHRAGQPLPPAPRPPPAQPGPAQPPRQPNAAAASRQRRPAREAAPAAPARAIATEAEALRAKLVPPRYVSWRRSRDRAGRRRRRRREPAVARARIACLLWAPPLPAEGSRVSSGVPTGLPPFVSR